MGQRNSVINEIAGMRRFQTQMTLVTPLFWWAE